MPEVLTHPSQRQVVVGDIHGCYRELCDLLDRIGPADDDLVLSLGDLVDRGPESLEVCRWFRDRQGARALMGNHERKHVRQIRSYAQDIVAVQMGDAYFEMVDWMAGFPYAFESEAAIVVHGAFEHDVPLANQREEVLAGTTSGERQLERRYGHTYWPEHYAGDKPIIFGHHVVGDEVKVWNDRVFGIDTGACHGGRLTAVVLPELRIVQVDSRGDHWRQQRAAWQAPVLAARQWGEMSFAQIERHLERAERHQGPDVAAVTGVVRAWLAELEAARAAIAAAIDGAVTRLLDEHGEAGFAGAASRHPAQSWLFRHRREAVDAAAVAAHCPSPAAVVSLAARLGLEVAARPTLTAPGTRSG